MRRDGYYLGCLIPTYIPKPFPPSKESDPEKTNTIELPTISNLPSLHLTNLLNITVMENNVKCRSIRNAVYFTAN